MGTNTTTLDQNGYGLCGVCRKKFFVGQLYTCAYCDKWICSAHKKNYKGMTVCTRCYEIWKKK